MRKATRFFLSNDYRDILGYSLALVFFIYLVVFACVAPSPALTGAVAFEICVYFAFLTYRLKRRGAKSVHARQAVTSVLILSIPGAELVSRLCMALAALGGSVVLVCALVDVLSFGLAAAGQYKAASAMYSRFPVSVLAGVNPGYTMELLSGAKVKAGQYADVERMYQALYDIRAKHFGARSERICDMYADFGDLAERRGDVQKAEAYYVYAIKLSNEIKVPQGCGKYLTRLGQLQADHGRYEEALKTLTEARSMRSRIFGEHSQKVADTLLVTSRVHQKMGNGETAKALAEQALSIHHSAPKTEVSLALYSAFFSVFVMLATYLLTDKNGWLTKLAIAKAQNILSEDNVSPEKKVELETYLQVLKEFTASSKSKAAKASNNHEAAHLSLILSLTSQDLR